MSTIFPRGSGGGGNFFLSLILMSCCSARCSSMCAASLHGSESCCKMVQLRHLYFCIRAMTDLETFAVDGTVRANVGYLSRNEPSPDCSTSESRHF